MTDAEERKRRAARKQRARDRRKQADDDLDQVLRSPAGRRVLARVIYGFGALEALAFQADPALRDFQSGQRAVGHAVLGEVKRVNRDAWALLSQERIEAERIEPVEPVPEPEDDEDE